MWLSVDPLADMIPGLSPYNYCINNPILLTDPDGKIPPLIVLGVVIAAKAIAGAFVDAGTQYGINRAQGLSHEAAMNNIDYTSVAASGVISGISAPGVSSAIKTTVVATALVADAGIDIDENTGTSTVMGIGGTNEKPLMNAAVDIGLGAIDLKASSTIVDGSKNAVANDLLPSNFATLDASGKQLVKANETLVNSGAFGQAVGTASGLTIGNNGMAGALLKTSAPQSTQKSTQTNFFEQYKPSFYTTQQDNTKIR